MTAPHIRQRVADESARMAAWIAEHEAFIGSPEFCELDAIERSLLLQQLNAMRGCSFALRARIHRWAAESVG